MSHPSRRTRLQRRLRLPAKFPADRIDPDALVQGIVELFPADEVERLARETGFQRRERKLDPVALLLTRALDRLRWEVELLFREAKGIFRLDQVRIKNRYVPEAMIWTGWLTLLVSRRLHNVVREALPVEWRERLPSRRWAKAFARVAGDLLSMTLTRLGRQWVLPQPMAEIAVRWEARALDPNLSRERFRRGWTT